MTSSTACKRAIALATAMLLAPMAAQAADPESGTLTLDTRKIEFSEGPNVGYNVTPLVGPECIDTVLPCDHFALTVDLPDDLVEFFPAALVKITVGWDDPAGAGAEDYDLYLYDEGGNEVNSSPTGANPEVMAQLANGGVENYTLDIVYFSNLGSTYQGVVELDLGEPAEGKDPEDLEEFFMQNSLLGHVWNNQLTGNQGQQTEADSRGNSSVERRSASGSLGLGVLMLGLLGLSRRRRG